MRMILCPSLWWAPASVARRGRSDNTQVIAPRPALLMAPHGSSWLSAWSWHSLVPGPTVRPCTHFPIVPPSTSPHTNCFTVRKPPLVARFGHHNIYLGAQNTSKTQKMLGLECGAQLGLGSPSPLSWGWDHDRSDHWPILSSPSRGRMPGDPPWHLIPASHGVMTTLSQDASLASSVPSAYLVLIS